MCLPPALILSNEQLGARYKWALSPISGRTALTGRGHGYDQLFVLKYWIVVRKTVAITQGCEHSCNLVVCQVVRQTLSLFHLR